MTKREEVAKELARELGAQVVSNVWRVPVDLTTHEYQHVPCAVRDALISREMRVRDFEQTLRAIENRLENIDARRLSQADEDRITGALHMARLALNSKGEKG